MHKLLKVLIAGTVINFITVPFLFAQNENNELTPQPLSLKKNSGGFELNKTGSLSSELKRIHLPDSTKLKDTSFTSKPTDFKKFRMKKKPWLAVLLSAGLPGAGQFYNQSYWKIPIIDGFIGYFVYEYIREDKNFRDYRDQYAASQTTEFPDGDPNLKALREFYRNQRNNFTWYFIVVYFINLVDAYVDAHLYDFTVKDEKLSSGLTDRKVNFNIHIPLK